LNLNGEGQAEFYFDCEDLSFPEILHYLEKINNRLFEPEIRKMSLMTRTILAAHSQCLNNTRSRIENRGTPTHMQSLDPAEVQDLEQFYESLLRIRKRRFCYRLIQMGTPIHE
jgi:hypothetical protein